MARRRRPKAFARARESAAGDKDAPERLAADYGLWVGSLRARRAVGDEGALPRPSSATSRREPDSPEAGVAHRVAGITHWFAGEYRRSARASGTGARPVPTRRDDDLAFRFGQTRASRRCFYLALTLWPLGDIGRAVSLLATREARIAGLAHIGTRRIREMHAAMFELMRGDLSRAASNAANSPELTREHDLPCWRACGVFLEGLAKAESGAPGERARGHAARRRTSARAERSGLRRAPQDCLAEAEARAGDVDRAVAILDEALATSERTGHRCIRRRTASRPRRNAA